MGAILFLAVHLGYGILAYHRLSVGHWLGVGFGILVLMCGVYAVIAYWMLPRIWRRHYRHQPKIAGTPKITHTRDGIPGDPLNVGLVGTEEEVVRAMLKAGWFPADPASFETVLGIAKSVLLHRPDPTAPVSNLYIGDRKQDLAFERPEGVDVKKRHHVRFWQAPGHEIEGRMLWIGAATFDRSYRISLYTGQILHRIAPEVDAERDKLVSDLSDAGEVAKVFQTTGLGVTLKGRNGEGDWYYTDGQIVIAELHS